MWRPRAPSCSPTTGAPWATPCTTGSPTPTGCASGSCTVSAPQSRPRQPEGRGGSGGHLPAPRHRRVLPSPPRGSTQPPCLHRRAGVRVPHGTAGHHRARGACPPAGAPRQPVQHPVSRLPCGSTGLSDALSLSSPVSGGRSCPHPGALGLQSFPCGARSATVPVTAGRVTDAASTASDQHGPEPRGSLGQGLGQGLRGGGRGAAGPCSAVEGTSLSLAAARKTGRLLQSAGLTHVACARVWSPRGRAPRGRPESWVGWTVAGRKPPALRGGASGAASASPWAPMAGPACPPPHWAPGTAVCPLPALAACEAQTRARLLRFLCF